MLDPRPGELRRDDPVPPVTPVREAMRVERLDSNYPERQRSGGLVITGRIVSVVPGHPHVDEGHVLDVSVGGGSYTEIVLRVPNSPHYGHLEGRDATLRVEGI